MLIIRNSFQSRKTGTRMSCETFNDLHRHNKTPREFSRRSRDMDSGRGLKAEEYRNLCIAFFSTVAAAIGEDRPEHELWLILVYVIRANIIPGEEPPFPLWQERAAHRKIHRLWNEIFGEETSSYNIHLLTHLPLIRKKGPLYKISAFASESSYSIFRDR